MAAGGVVGAGLRWMALSAWPIGSGFPWVVLLINCLGSFVLGVILAEEWTHPRARLVLHDAGGIGLCGGLTTFSTFAVEVVDLLDRQHVATAVTYAVVSLAGAIACAVVGAAILRQVRALTTPVEA